MPYMRDSSGRRLDSFTVASTQDTDAWSVISSRPVKLGTGATSASATGVTARYAEVAPFDVTSVRLVYANWQNLFGATSYEYPNYSGYRVKAAVHKGGAAAPDRAVTDWMAQGLFGGKEFGYCQPGGFLLTDPIPVTIKQGERWFHESYGDVYLIPGPAAPTLAVQSGGSLGTATFYAVITYVMSDGSESLPSPEASVALAAGTQTVLVTSPAAYAGAVGWRCYFSVGGSANPVKYENPSFPMVPFGTNMTISSGISGTALHRMARTPAYPGLPTGMGMLGGLNGASLGEVSIAGRDYTTAPVAWAGVPTFSLTFGPIAVLGLAADGKVHNSVCLLGDSIQSGTGDTGYGGAMGGFVFRACGNQTQALYYDPAKTPALGFMQLAQGGESAAQFATTVGSSRRRVIAERATTIIDNYGTNDLGGGSATIYATLLSIFQWYQGRKRYFHTTLDPKTTSTDGWLTISNQTIASTDAEGDRRAINNCLRDATGAVAVTGEALFRSPGTATAATVLTGGDGAAVKFTTAYPFRTGTETIQVAGVTKAVTTDYAYRQTAVIAGITYATGITFVTAPANAATVTASYTKAASFPSMSGWTGTLDTAAVVEVNAAGTAGTNGGFWKPANVTGAVTGAVTTASGSVLNDTVQTWTTDQFRGWVVQITADATTPASVGQVVGIKSNTATQLALGNAWATAPSPGATYQVYRSHTIDGTHPTSHGHMLKSQAVDASKF